MFKILCKRSNTFWDDNIVAITGDNKLLVKSPIGEWRELMYDYNKDYEVIWSKDNADKKE